MPSQQDVSEIIVDGLTAFAVGLSEMELGKAGAQMYQFVQREVDPLLHPGDECKLAFPSMLIRPDLRIECLVAILTDRVILAWEKGFIRRKTFSIVIPRAGITGVHRHPGSNAGTRNAALLTLSGPVETTIALPVGKAGAAEALIRSALV
jgi:hypothetical protein